MVKMSNINFKLVFNKKKSEKHFASHEKLGKKKAFQRRVMEMIKGMNGLTYQKTLKG